MNQSLMRATCVLALTLSAAVTMHAQDTPVPPDVKAFAARYVAAFSAKDKAQLYSLYPTRFLSCLTPDNKAVYDALLSMQMRDPVPPDYLLSFLPVNDGNLKAFADTISFPVKPERELHIDYQYPNTNDAGQIVIWLVRQNGRWVADFPCMTDHGIQEYRDDADAREHYNAIAAAIKEPLRSELIAMLRAHQTGEASSRYKEATGSDMRTSMLVVDALRNQMQ